MVISLTGSLELKNFVIFSVFHCFKLNVYDKEYLNF